MVLLKQSQVELMEESKEISGVALGKIIGGISVEILDGIPGEISGETHQRNSRRNS